MEALAAHAPSIAEVGVLVDVGLVEVDQPVPVALSRGQQRAQSRDKALPPRRVGTAEQLLGFLPRQAEPVQGGADGLAAAPAGKSRPHEADQPLERPARLGAGAAYGRPGRLSLGGADRRTQRGLDLGAKGGRPPVRRYCAASGPPSLSRCSHPITVCGCRPVRSATSLAQPPRAISCKARKRSRLRAWGALRANSRRSPLVWSQRSWSTRNTKLNTAPQENPHMATATAAPSTLTTGLKLDAV